MKGQSRGRAVPTYALVFRTHFWDSFVERQFRRIAAVAPGADVYVMVDETRGAVEGIAAPNVFRLTDRQIVDAGYVAAGEGSLQWYSGDVPLYLFYAAHPDYAVYIQVEYDVNIHVDLDGMADRIIAEGIDVVVHRNAKAPADWPYMTGCLDLYETDEVRHSLICVSAFSNKALKVLSYARLAHAARFQAGEIAAWPYCEAFVPSEAARQKLVTGELSEFGDTAHYDWWPPYLESDLPVLQGSAFVHPVLDKPRYRASLLKQTVAIRTLLSPRGWYNRKLLRMGRYTYIRTVFGKPYRQLLGRSVRMSAEMRQRRRRVR